MNDFSSSEIGTPEMRTPPLIRAVAWDNYPRDQ